MKKIILSSLLMTQLFIANVFADNELKTSNVFVTATRTPIAKNISEYIVYTVKGKDIRHASIKEIQKTIKE